MKRRSGADARRDMALGSRSLVSGLQIFGVLAVAVVAAAFAPLLLPGPRTTDGSAPPAAASAVVARVPGVGPTAAAPTGRATETGGAHAEFADSALAVAAARETATTPDATGERDSRRSGVRTLAPTDEPRARSKRSSHSASARHDNGRKVRPHASPSSPAHTAGARPNNGHKQAAKGHGHGSKPKAKKAKRR
jgi:hypothetical protein